MQGEVRERALWLGAEGAFHGALHLETVTEFYRDPSPSHLLHPCAPANRNPQGPRDNTKHKLLLSWKMMT